MRLKALIIIVLTGIIFLSFRIDFKNVNEETIILEREEGPELTSEFLKLRFGMFIHYNMATYQGAQWVEGYPDPSEFDPGVETIDTDAWADAAVAAGMKYGVLTVKHVSGFFYIWNDGLDPDIMEAGEILPYFNSVRPGILVSSNWWDWSKKGTPYADIAVTEMRHFPESNIAPGETCWHLEQAWFWNNQFKSNISASEVIKHISMANSRNANFLLNVGPDRNGNIIESSINTLKEIGKEWK